MVLRIEDYYEVAEAATIPDLENVLRKRYGRDVNSFWLFHDGEKHRALALLVRGDLASIHYFPEQGHAGFQSIGNLQGLDPSASTVFMVDTPEQEIEVPNKAVVSFSTALAVAQEFFASKELPRLIEWLEL